MAIYPAVGGDHDGLSLFWGPFQFMKEGATLVAVCFGGTKKWQEWTDGRWRQNICGVVGRSDHKNSYLGGNDHSCFPIHWDLGWISLG